MVKLMLVDTELKVNAEIATKSAGKAFCDQCLTNVASDEVGSVLVRPSPPKAVFSVHPIPIRLELPRRTISPPI
jgi:hypothetical protein